MLHNVIIAQNLSIGYRNKKKQSVIASGIDFKISEGSLVAIVGSNGIGKSTLLKTLTNILPPLEGKIAIQDKALQSYSSLALASKLSVVLTETVASKNLTVHEMVSLGRQPHTNWMGKLTAQDHTIIAEALQDTDMQNLAHRSCFELSDGQLQRAYIARALAQDTPLIILDEPTTHLDLYHRASIVKLLKKLAVDKNKTILFSTHEIDLAIQITDKMLVMTKDNLVFDTPRKLIEQGAFDALFPNEIVVFDKKTGRFSVT